MKKISTLFWEIFSKLLPDKLYLQILFRKTMGYSLDLHNPKTFNEKLQWLKLYDRKPSYTNMVDKYEAKKYVANAIGKRYVIPTYGIYESFEEIDFDNLPNQFVLKCTHDSGSIVICRDKNTFDIEAAKKKINKCLKRNFYWAGREWPYKNIKPRIMIEKYMENNVNFHITHDEVKNNVHDLRDYKFFCFDGKVKALFIASDRFTNGEETKFDFFDAEFNHLPFTSGHPNAKEPPVKPKTFEEMKLLATKLAQKIPHIRIDFYEVNRHVYFGEFTFFHWSGMVPFIPKEWDLTFGSWINLQYDFPN